MKRVDYPNPFEWKNLIVRPAIDKASLDASIQNVLEQVRDNGDKALFEFTKAFDKVELETLQVSDLEIAKAKTLLDTELKDAIRLAADNIRKFHGAQISVEERIETTPGVICWRKDVAIDKVGLYIPGGSAPLFSTILMLGVPANIAGCSEIVLCTPPRKDGSIDPAILFTADLVGVKKIFKVGGAQAIAGMAYGTKTIPQVYKIFGPGNQYVTRAKEMVQQEGVAIDMPAGPSEVMVIADESCNPAFVAADVLSQAEHGADSQVILLCTDITTMERCMKQVELQLESLPRKDIAEKALQNSRAILFISMEDCIEFSNEYAPEHLIIASKKAESFASGITNAGSVFLGNYSCESAGDYASGTNHTLPTNGFARNYSGVSLDSFVKKITFQSLSAKGIQNIGPAIELMAEAEQLIAHKNAVTVRLKALSNE